MRLNPEQFRGFQRSNLFINYPDRLVMKKRVLAQVQCFHVRSNNACKYCLHRMAASLVTIRIGGCQ